MIIKDREWEAVHYLSFDKIILLLLTNRGIQTDLGLARRLPLSASLLFCRVFSCLRRGLNPGVGSHLTSLPCPRELFSPLQQNTHLFSPSLYLPDVEGSEEEATTSSDAAAESPIKTNPACFSTLDKLIQGMCEHSTCYFWFILRGFRCQQVWCIQPGTRSGSIA